jgi:hypothetical protein
MPFVVCAHIKILVGVGVGDAVLVAVGRALEQAQGIEAVAGAGLGEECEGFCRGVGARGRARADPDLVAVTFFSAPRGDPALSPGGATLAGRRESGKASPATHREQGLISPCSPQSAPRYLWRWCALTL